MKVTAEDMTGNSPILNQYKRPWKKSKSYHFVSVIKIYWGWGTTHTPSINNNKQVVLRKSPYIGTNSKPAWNTYQYIGQYKSVI